MTHVANNSASAKKIPLNKSATAEEGELMRQADDVSSRAVKQQWWWSAADASRPVYGPYEI